MTSAWVLAYIAGVERHFLGIASIALACATGCSEPQVSLQTGPREYVATDYPEVLKRWTRSGSLVAIAQLDDLLSVSATYDTTELFYSDTNSSLQGGTPRFAYNLAQSRIGILVPRYRRLSPPARLMINHISARLREFGDLLARPPRRSPRRRARSRRS